MRNLSMQVVSGDGGWLTFNRENAGAGGSSSAVDSFTHVLSFVLGERFRQVQAVGLPSLNVLVVFRVRQQLTFKPPGDLWFGFSCDLHCEPHRLCVNHRLVLQGLFKPRSTRPGVVLFILVGCGAVNDATLFLLLFFPFLTRHMTKCFTLRKNSKATEITRMQLCHALVLRSVHHLALKQSSP